MRSTRAGSSTRTGFVSRTHFPFPLTRRSAPSAPPSRWFWNQRLTGGQLLDTMEEDAKAGGLIIDWHACDLFPKSWIDLVVVLRAGSATLYDRLKARDYPEAKLQENLDSELMDVLIQEAREAYDEEIVIELQSNSADEMDENVERVEAWVRQWKVDNAGAE